MLSDLGLALSLLIKLEQMYFFGFEVILELGNLVVTESAFQLLPHLVDLPLNSVVFALALPQFLGLATDQTRRINLRLNAFLSLGLDTIELHLHLADDHQKFRLELVVDLSDADGF